MADKQKYWRPDAAIEDEIIGPVQRGGMSRHQVNPDLIAREVLTQNQDGSWQLRDDLRTSEFWATVMSNRIPVRLAWKTDGATWRVEIQNQPGGDGTEWKDTGEGLDLVSRPDVNTARLVEDDLILKAGIDATRSTVARTDRTALTQTQATHQEHPSQEQPMSDNDQKVKDWYTRQFPNDDLGSSINPDLTFQDAADRMGSIYDALGVGDSVVRERVMYGVAGHTGMSLNQLYARLLGQPEETAPDDLYVPKDMDGASIDRHIAGFFDPNQTTQPHQAQAQAPASKEETTMTTNDTPAPSQNRYSIKDPNAPASPSQTRLLDALADAGVVSPWELEGAGQLTKAQASELISNAQTTHPDTFKEVKEQMAAERAQARAQARAERAENGRPEFANVKIPAAFIKPYTMEAKDGRTFSKAYVNIPPGTKVNGVDLTGYSLSVFMSDRMTNQMLSGDRVTVGFKTDQPVQVWTGKKDDPERPYKQFEIKNPWDLVKGLAARQKEYDASHQRGGQPKTLDDKAADARETAGSGQETRSQNPPSTVR